jgi:lipase maturation factor 1
MPETLFTNGEHANANPPWWKNIVRALFDSQYGAADRLLPRWLFLRALGLIYFSAFYSLVFQVRGLIGTNGVLPARDYLQFLAQNAPGLTRFWYAPSLYWLASSSGAILTFCWIGLIAAVLVFFNVWPRVTLLICFLCFLSFVSAASDFSSYQSDGMLLEAGFIALFFAPPGLRPGLAAAHPPSRASLFLLQWEWLRIYFESGIVKLASGDPQWRTFTAMDEYYQNGPLPTWIGWYVQHLPHRFHAFSAGATLVLELGLIWMILLPRRFRIALFVLVTCWELGVISTANYAFLNYLVLSLGILLVDDRFLEWLRLKLHFKRLAGLSDAGHAREVDGSLSPINLSALPGHFRAAKLALATVMLTWIFYATSAELLRLLVRQIPLPGTPVVALEPFRIANQYGLFAVMTRVRYEIEFQGSNDGQTWTAYTFRYKPQALNEPPTIFAPYQPRFDWNLWFASLETWRDSPIVPNTEVRLLSNDRSVLGLFSGNPFVQSPPKQVRAVLWQYWFTSMDEKRKTGNWWRREFLGLYAPTISLGSDGKPYIVERPNLESREP